MKCVRCKTEDAQQTLTVINEDARSTTTERVCLACFYLVTDPASRAPKVRAFQWPEDRVGPVARPVARPAPRRGVGGDMTLDAVLMIGTILIAYIRMVVECWLRGVPW